MEDLVEGVNPEAVTRTKDIRLKKDVLYKKKPIYDKLPHITADNHFCGDAVLQMIGEKGGSMTATSRKDRIPKQAKPYLHHEKIESSSKLKLSRAKVGRFQNPITVIKKFAAAGNKKAFYLSGVSFQSTGPTNIFGVNNLPSVSLYVTVKGRGIGATKRLWGIEQNEARQIYLGTYFGVDNVDHMIKIAKIRYICWKYWHSPVNHCLSIAVIASYDMYNECCDGGLDPEWAVPTKDRMTFSKFRQTLSKQMLAYNPVLNKYPGDSNFRTVTKLTQDERASIQSSNQTTLATIKEGEPLLEAFVKAKTPEPGLVPPRLCGQLDNLQKHLSSIEKKSWKSPCAMCGTSTLWKCTICDTWLCTAANKSWNGAECAVRYHNDSCFGLANCDHQYTGLKRRWRAPTANDITRNKNKIQRMLAGLKK